MSGAVKIYWKIRGKTDKMVVPHVVTQDIVVHQGKALVTQSTYDLILIELKRFY